LICQTTNFLGEKFLHWRKKNSYDADRGGKRRCSNRLENLVKKKLDS
jgi:hypothetical protein